MLKKNVTEVDGWTCSICEGFFLRGTVMFSCEERDCDERPARRKSTRDKQERERERASERKVEGSGPPQQREG